MSSGTNYGGKVRARGQGFLILLNLLLLLGMAACLGGFWFAYHEYLKLQASMAVPGGTSVASADLTRVESELELLRKEMKALGSRSNNDDAYFMRFDDVDSQLKRIDGRFTAISELQSNVLKGSETLVALQKQNVEINTRLSLISAALPQTMKQTASAGEDNSQDLLMALSASMKSTFTECCDDAFKSQLAKLDVLEGKLAALQNALNKFASEHEPLENDTTDKQLTDLLTATQRIEAGLKPLENMVDRDAHKNANDRLEAGILRLAQFYTSLRTQTSDNAKTLTTIQAHCTAIQAAVAKANTSLALAATQQQLREVIGIVNQLAAKPAPAANEPQANNNNRVTPQLVQQFAATVGQHCDRVINAVTRERAVEADVGNDMIDESVLHMELPLRSPVPLAVGPGGEMPAFQFQERLSLLQSTRGLILDSIDFKGDYPLGVVAEAELDEPTNSVIVRVYWSGDPQTRQLLAEQIRQRQWGMYVKLVREIDRNLVAPPFPDAKVAPPLPLTR